MDEEMEDAIARDAIRVYYMRRDVILAASLLQESSSFAAILCPAERLVAAKASVRKARFLQYRTDLSSGHVLGVETRSTTKRRLEDK